MTRFAFALFPFAFAAAALAPAGARATCMTSCAATLMSPACELPNPADEWPASEALSFSAACETCCSPPGGPVECGPAAAEDQAWSVWREGVEVAGSFAKLPDACDEQIVLAFDGALAPGAHELHAGNIILAFFQVKPSEGCTSDADCGGCEQCADAVCVAPGCAATCATDADCGPSAQCVETVPGCCTECQAVGPVDDAGGPADDGGGTEPGEVDAAIAQEAVDDDTGMAADAAVGADLPAGGTEVAGDASGGEATVPAGEDAITVAGDGSPGGKGGSGSGCSAGPVPEAGVASLLLIPLLASIRRRREPSSLA